MLKQMIYDLIEIFDEEYSKRYLITPQNTAEKLTAKGYRKSTEVAREIFAEIEGSISLFSFTDEDVNYEWGVHDALVWVDEKIAELKKKYTEEGK